MEKSLGMAVEALLLRSQYLAVCERSCVWKRAIGQNAYTEPHGPH